MRLPSFWNYGDQRGKSGINSLAFDLGSDIIYFSYKTIVAFSTLDTGLVVSENVWGITTGKHLNWINRDKKSRLPHQQFMDELHEALGIA